MNVMSIRLLLDPRCLLSRILAHMLSFGLSRQRMASHIQIFAMSRWLPVVLPVEYYEFARGLQWSVPYFNLPWETEQMQQFMVGSSTPSGNSYSSKIHDSGLFHGVKPDLEHVGVDPTVYGLPLTPMEYGSVFEVRKHYVYKNLKASFPFVSS